MVESTGLADRRNDRAGSTTVHGTYKVHYIPWVHTGQTTLLGTSVVRSPPSAREISGRQGKGLYGSSLELPLPLAKATLGCDTDSELPRSVWDVWYLSCTGAGPSRGNNGGRKRHRTSHQAPAARPPSVPVSPRGISGLGLGQFPPSPSRGRRGPWGGEEYPAVRCKKQLNHVQGHDAPRSTPRACCLTDSDILLLPLVV